MGLTLHFGGRIRNPRQLPELMEEVADICRSMDWDHRRYDEILEVPAKALPKEPGKQDPKEIHLQGISFTPPDCETVSIACTQSGRLTSRFHLRVAHRFPDPQFVYQLHVKTQYAGPELHIYLVTLLKYLEKKYFSRLWVHDEGNYWNTLDKAVLLKRFEDYWSLIDAFKSALKKEPPAPSGDSERLTD